MNIYPTIVTLHIIFAGLWLIYFLAERILKSQIEGSSNIDLKNQSILMYIQFSNIFGIIGATGIAISGIVMVLLNNSFGFFSMASNHWLATKQILFVIILVITFALIIPTSKKIITQITAMGDNGVQKLLDKFYKQNLIINIIVLINFIFAITHRFYS
ncbi:MAG: hypothetical protein V3V16_01920 [Melioribacteraceae bacterium]